MPARRLSPARKMLATLSMSGSRRVDGDQGRDGVVDLVGDQGVARRGEAVLLAAVVLLVAQDGGSGSGQVGGLELDQHVAEGRGVLGQQHVDLVAALLEVLRVPESARGSMVSATTF